MADYNNNNVRRVQHEGEAASSSSGSDRSVALTFLGHAAFRLESSQGLSIVVDPWTNDASGHWGLWYHRIFPQLTCDIGLSTHDHFDHNAMDRLQATMKLERLVGSFSLGDVRIDGFADKHSTRGSTGELFHELQLPSEPPDNHSGLDNVMFRITASGITFLFWGDNRAGLPEETAAAICTQKIDVLVIPVDDSQHLLTYDEVAAITARFNPTLVVPCHYLTRGVASCLSTLKTADEFLAAHKDSLIATDSATQTLNRSFLDADRRPGTVLSFGHHLPFDPEALQRAELSAVAVCTYAKPAK